MESKILSSVGKVAGLGGIALGVLLLIFQGVLQQKFLPQAGLESAQAFAVILSLMILTFGIAGIGVIAWLVGRTVGPTVPVPGPTLWVLAALIAGVAGAAVYVGANAQPRPKAQANSRGVAIVGDVKSGGGVTTGDCSPIVTDSTSNIAITLNCSFGGGSFEVELLRATLSCNNEVEARDQAEGILWRGERVQSARDLFRRIQRYHDRFVYVDLFILVGGAGCGLRDVKGTRYPRWGVVYQLDLDGFTGNHSAYEYGYQIDFNTYAAEISHDDGGKNRLSTLLLPKNDNAFFSARFSKAMFLEGLAKIKISEVQGFQYIEIVPAAPHGALADHYSKFKKYLKQKYGNS